MCALPQRLREIAGVVPASRLERPSAPMVSFGVPELDTLTGGLPRGGLTELCGATSSGRTTLALAALAAATSREELCALIDVSDSFDPQSAQAAGVNLDKLLWIRCGGTNHSRESTHTNQRTPLDITHDNAKNLQLRSALHAQQQTGAIMPPAKVWYGRAPARSERTTQSQTNQDRHLEPRDSIHNRHDEPKNNRQRPADPKRACTEAHEQALKATDLLLQGGGFGMVILDMGDVPVEIARRIPLTSWFRFRRAVENTPTVLLTIEQEPCAKTCASLVLRASGIRRLLTVTNKTEGPSHTRVFGGIESAVEVLRSRVEGSQELTRKKPPRGVSAEFSSRTEWAG